MDSQHLCLPSPPPVPVLSVFLESAFAPVSLSPLHLCPLLKADRGTYAQKADNSPLGTSGTGKQTALLCVSPLEFTATASLLKRSTFIMRWRLESALYLILTRLPFSPRVVHHIHWSLADWQEYQHDSRDSNSQLSTTLTLGGGGTCILSFCYYLERCVYGAHSLQSHLKHQLHSKACKQSCGCKSCLMMITQGLGLLSTQCKCRIVQWMHWSVSEHGGWGDTTVLAETTPTGYHPCGALEKLIRLLILVAIWVRWSHKGIHILRINKGSATTPQKPPRERNFTQPEG